MNCSLSNGVNCTLCEIYIGEILVQVVLQSSKNVIHSENPMFLTRAYFITAPIKRFLKGFLFCNPERVVLILMKGFI